MSALSNILNAELRKALGSMTFGKPVLAINLGGAATVKTTNAITYTIDGVVYTKAALAAQSIAVTHDCFGNPVASGVASYVQPVGTTVYYLLSLDSGGNVKVSQGSYAGQSLTFPGDISKVVLGAGGIPAEPAGCTAFGLIKVAPTVAATFNPGTTALDAANVNATYFDLSAAPSVAP